MRTQSDPPACWSSNGEWSAPWSASPVAFTAIHGMLVSTGVHRGKVLMWDGPGVDPATTQEVAVWSPAAPTSLTRQMLLAGPNQALWLPSDGGGNWFCAGHTWLDETGEAFVVGGTNAYNHNPGPPPSWDFRGSRGVTRLLPSPTNASVVGTWVREVRMTEGRWYPGVCLIPPAQGGGSRWRVFACAGRSLGGTFLNNYEIFTAHPNPTQLGTWSSQPLAGPSTYGFDVFYPNLFTLSDDQHMFVTTLNGQGGTPTVGPKCQLFKHQVTTGAVWQDSAEILPLDGPVRSSALAVYVTWLPGISDRVYIFGGDPQSSMPPYAVHDTVLRANITPAGTQVPFTKLTALMYAGRINHSVPILPNRRILIVGGSSINFFQPELPVLVPDLFDPATETFTRMASHVSPRTYHSIALLMPDGKVLSAGGTDSRTCDFQLFSPPYITCATTWRPSADSVNATDLTRGQAYEIKMSSDQAAVGRVALMRPCSKTHNVEFDQRYIECPIVARDPNANSLTFQVPSGRSVVPPGWYMLWVAATLGETPAYNALWVKVVAGSNG